MQARLFPPLLLMYSLAQSPQLPSGEWRTTGGDAGAARHSALTQITRDNVARLQQVWSFDTGADNLQVTPIVADGTMYLTGASTVFAIIPETGKQLWRFDAAGMVSRRGVGYWPGDGTRPPRISPVSKVDASLASPSTVSRNVLCRRATCLAKRRGRWITAITGGEPVGGARAGSMNADGWS